MELVVYISGSSILRTPKIVHSMERGSVCLIPPDVVTSHLHSDNGEIEYVNFLFLEDRLQLGDLSLTELENYHALTRYQGTGQNRISPVFYLDDALVQEIQTMLPEIMTAQTFQPPRWRFYCSGAILYLLSRIIGECHREQENSDTAEKRIEQSVNYIKRHCSQPLTLKMLADKARMSPSSYSHHFKLLRNISPVEYLIRCRLRKAISLLDSHSDIKQIAHGSGFTAHAYFARVLRKRFGISPSQFRELPIQEQAHIFETS